VNALCHNVSWRQPKGTGRLAVDWVYRNCDVLLENRVKAKLWVMLVVRFNIRITHSVDRDSSTTTIEPYTVTAGVKKIQGNSLSPSGISDFCGTVAEMVTPKGSVLTEGETLQVSVLPYRCSICPPLVTRQMSIL